MVAVAAWLLTSIRGTSATTKYWIWVITTFNLVVPSGAIIDKLFTPHLTWARPLGAVGGPVWHMTEGRTAVVLGAMWIAGTSSMLLRLISRLGRERREAQALGSSRSRAVRSDFVSDSIPVRFDDKHPSPSVWGVFRPRILLPIGIDELLDPREFDAVLLHEVAHARRRDNLIRLIYEVSLCALWFHPLIWVAGARMALYRELSCDEVVVRRAHGQALISALAKLAIPERPAFLQATASSHLSYRLACLTEPAPIRHRAASLLLTSLFGAAMAAGIYQTIAHTACCFLLKR
jgi:beta-lactamase regulating signal transducer with metallopeptidase domain